MRGREQYIPLRERRATESNAAIWPRSRRKWSLQGESNSRLLGGNQAPYRIKRWRHGGSGRFRPCGRLALTSCSNDPSCRVPTGVTGGIQTHSNRGHVPARLSFRHGHTCRYSKMSSHGGLLGTSLCLALPDGVSPSFRAVAARRSALLRAMLVEPPLPGSKPGILV